MAAKDDGAQFDAELSALVERHRGRILPLRILVARWRLFAALTLGALAGLLAPEALGVVTRALIGWNVATISYILLVLFSLRDASHRHMRLRAKLLDEGRFFVLGMTALAAVVAICAIVLEMGAAKKLEGAAQALHLSVAASTIFSSWFFVHFTFALHYAHEYYLERETCGADEALPDDDEDDEATADADDTDHSTASSDTRGGLIFPDTNHPSYLDFAYFSYVIGVASQTADVMLSSRSMRAVALAHCILSFFFNTTILALTINLAASLFG